MIEFNNLINSKVMIYDPDIKRSASPVMFGENEIVKGKVIEILDSETAIINIKGRNFSAKTLVPLKIGADMAFKVERLTPVPVLKPLGIQFVKPEAASIPTILSAIEDNLWKSVFEKITTVKGSTPEKISYNQIVENLPKKLLESGRSEYLKEIIDRSGLFFEAKLKGALEQKPINAEQIRQLINNDVKGLLSDLLSKTDNEEAKQLLSVIKNLQMLDISGLEQERKIFIPLPFLLPDGQFCVAQLLFQLPMVLKDAPEESAEENGQLKISLLLELSSLGPIRADFTLNGKMVYGMFRASIAETVEILETEMDSFVKNLEDKGFSIKHIECRLKEPEIVTEPLLLDMIQATENNINLVG
ncbi:MAG: flagellar hook-length control protein FliK [Desulfobacterium sp.]|nr:flagellar hook-length control protein FliK [Desulfobacterium sp.]MBU3948925.1 flagellar hook-length control protein FliK [Pseudomonadota bacterium]MBU4035953.1 flagellar hook-length control protein FliK [Pseudomonadota bacterium]